MSYECGRLITRNNKLISISYAVLITFSQTVQWWYSINELMEMLIFGQLAVVLLNRFFVNKVIWKKLIICLGLIECLGGYLLAYYPAWQIPLAYVFLALAIYVLARNRKSVNRYDILMLIVTVVVGAVIIVAVLYNSLPAIKTTLNTVYPGRRTDTGGETDGIQLFYYIIDIFTPIDPKNLTYNSNVCDSAVFFSLFPTGIFATVYSMIRRRRFDILNVLLIAIELFCLIFCIFGFPEFLAKISMFNYTLSRRVMGVVGFIDILLLVRFLAGKHISHISKKVQTIVYLMSATTCLLVAGGGTSLPDTKARQQYGYAQ